MHNNRIIRPQMASDVMAGHRGGVRLTSATMPQTMAATGVTQDPTRERSCMPGLF